MPLWTNHSRAFILQDRLPHHGEAEVAGLDESGVDGADRDLVHAGPLDRHERERPGVGPHRRRRPGVAAHRVPALGPVLVQDEAPQEGVPDGDDAEQIVDLALEPAGRKGQAGQGGHVGAGGVEPTPSSARRSGGPAQNT